MTKEELLSQLKAIYENCDCLRTFSRLRNLMDVLEKTQETTSQQNRAVNREAM